ncbi:Z1 domain-containing protein [Arthrobacter zhaoxinii]|uniref:Z1 domain-containing protein n=1 Tax=Arthrobacter zhaoxinii TaxID=2964616 RepID=A0ABY5YUS4_9MICC|nr:Z1 domain-containing protein [Arthrobacter zhaoxinii]UWX97744.1 Z1 domain-containing protein [Arthrobacter zhaoxinii]
MNHAYIRELIIREVREKASQLPDAARMVIRNLGGTATVQRVVRDVIAQILAETKINEGWPNGFDAHTHSPWYTGVEAGDRHWPAYVEKMEGGSLANAVKEIDRTTHEIVSRLADPRTYGTKKKGLVLGYVQSGKTANYSGVISKAADAGYQLIIVLAGTHNNLRRQTQVRLDKDLLRGEWYPLTADDRDFRNFGGGPALLKSGTTKALAVVKKQRDRLGALRDWLTNIPADIRRTVPVLIIDDEADQATPNTKAASEELSKINELLREIWGLVISGTYVGYTATPFANVFMDPNDEAELYPSDFITSLPKPDGYFGAERLFGGSAVISEEDEALVDAIRYVPECDSEVLRPPADREEREGFKHEIPASLQDAVLWFVVATAIRRARGQAREHSSMLVHTTHYTAPHTVMKNSICKYLQELRKSVKSGDFDALKVAYEVEISRCDNLASENIPIWEEVENHINTVITACRVVVDNGESRDRLDYDRRDEAGNLIVETVIAVGGGTLSRGLTLEGLVVSYFLRTSSTYDTLLQMGRWFGYRRGYEDLPRIWMPADLKLDFEFLAMVEIELRDEIARMAAMEMTPRELGIRIRSHPGRLAITSRNKLVHAERTNLSFTGTRLQTFIFDTDKDVIADNQSALRGLLIGKSVSDRSDEVPAFALFEKLSADEVSRFFANYQTHKNQTNMPGDFISEWITQKANHTEWNVAVMGLKEESTTLGSLDIVPGLSVPAVNRAPLASSSAGEANIKALLSLSDYVADISTAITGQQSELDSAAFQKLRKTHAGGRGLLIIYVVSANSVPTRAPKAGQPPVRRAMEAADHMIGVGVVFPGFDQINDVTDGDFYSVTPDWEVPDGDHDGFPLGDSDDEDNGDALPDEWAWLNGDV